MRSTLWIGTAALLATWGGAAAGAPYAGYQSAIYSELAHWVCHPDGDDPCDRELDATIVAETGELTVEPWTPASHPAFDCFYLYPTISLDPTGNSDLVPGENEEIQVTRVQAARLGSVCRVFAPVYRQVTLTALIAGLGGNPIPSDTQLANADILDAWRHYIANDNGGRGVLLIGHSQGASRLITLLREEIDPSPVLRRRLVSAMLLGTNFQVPEGADVGAHLANIPLCASGDQTGCVVSYVSFRATDPPPQNSRFGGAQREGWQTACTNPAQLASGTNVLTPYLPSSGRGLPIGAPLPPPRWVDPALGTVVTPFVTLPGLLEAECRQRDGFTYLAITVHGDPEDPRIDDIGGDLTPDWGLHLVDASIAMGDLITIAGRQGAAHTAQQCPGDCDTDGVVRIDELLFGVGVLLERHALDRCVVLDRNRDGTVRVDEVLGAIHSALSGCES